MRGAGLRDQKTVRGPACPFKDHQSSLIMWLCDLVYAVCYEAEPIKRHESRERERERERERPMGHVSDPRIMFSLLCQTDICELPHNLLKEEKKNAQQFCVFQQ